MEYIYIYIYILLMEYTGKIEGQYGNQEDPKKCAQMRKVPENTGELVTILWYYTATDSVVAAAAAATMRTLLVSCLFPSKEQRVPSYSHYQFRHSLVSDFHITINSMSWVVQ
jgi:hypothetical protein